MKILQILFVLLVSINTVSFSNTLDSGLVAFYPFNGNALDESGNGNHGINNGATLSSDRFGSSNRAFYFNRNYIEIPNSPSLQSPRTSMSLAFWINISQWDQSNSGIMAKSNSNTVGQYGSVASTGPNYMQFDIGGSYVRINRYFALNTWYFLCLRWDGAEAKLYLNESVYDSVPYTGTVAPDNFPLTLGKHSPGGVRYLIGKLDDVRIYNRALHDSEIEQLFYEGNLDVRVVPQGFYDPLTQRARMKDTVRVYLREPYFPYTVVDSSKALIDSVLLEGSFRTLVAPGSYYIVVKHRNSIETWSSAPVYIEATAMSYDFTLFAAQAYGNNLVLNGNNYCIYGGDVNQDGIVDASDGSMTDNDANNFVTGYAQTDLTGDKFVDGSDNTIADNNASAFVSVMTPLSYQPPCNLTCARFFTWSGFTWCVMTSDGTKCYPGPNYFSSSYDNVFVDSTGDLHMRITKRNGKFYCPELFTTQTVGYGTYTFYIASRVNNLDRNTVLGLFTWNDKNCVTNANSEVDIEFTRWGDANDPDVINYSIQPTNAGQETDRFTKWPMSFNGNNTIHFMNWTPSLVTWSSYEGHSNPPPPGNLISSWSFDDNNLPKIKEECNSNPIVIPSPESNTHLSLNLWLDRGRYPSDDMEVEVVIRSIEFTAMGQQ